MPERNPLVAIGDTISVKLPRDTTQYVRFGIQSLGGAVGLTGVLEASMDNGVTWENFPAVPAAGGAASSAPAAVGSWSAPAPGYTDVRYRVTGLTSGGPIVARINVSEGM